MKALVEHDDRYLLLEQRVSDGYLWTLPGGKVAFGESPIDTLRREVREEVGLSIDVGSPVAVYDFRYDDIHIVATVIKCMVATGASRVDTGANPADETITRHEWIPRGADVSDRRMNDGLTQVLNSL